MTRTALITISLALALLLAGCTAPGNGADSEPAETPPGGDDEAEPSAPATTGSEEFEGVDYFMDSYSDDEESTTTSRYPLGMGGSPPILVKAGAQRLTLEGAFTGSVAVFDWRMCAYGDGHGAPDPERQCVHGTDSLSLVLEPDEEFELRPGNYHVLTWVNKPDDLPAGAAVAAMFEWHAVVEYPAE